MLFSSLPIVASTGPDSRGKGGANIAQMTDENSVDVSRVAATAGQLKSMSDELKQAVSGFRV
jgi:hypothetical protein